MLTRFQLLFQSALFRYVAMASVSATVPQAILQMAMNASAMLAIITSETNRMDTVYANVSFCARSRISLINSKV